MAQLEDSLRSRQVLESVDAQIPQTGSLGQAIAGQVGRGLGQHGLAAMTQIAKPGRPV